MLVLTAVSINFYGFFLAAVIWLATTTPETVGHTPCGYVEFNAETPRIVNLSTGQVYESIVMTVHMPDGTVQRVTLDYPFEYQDRVFDPFQNERAPMLFQFPPPEKRAQEPPIVQYVMQNTTSQGYTKLKNC